MVDVVKRLLYVGVSFLALLGAYPKALRGAARGVFILASFADVHAGSVEDAYLLK